ncbi:hypothetical protein ACRRTK_018542 [Alexandromys fortis]
MPSVFLCDIFAVEEEALIKNNNTCKDFLIEAMKYHLLPLDQRLLIKNPRTKPRTPVSLPKHNKYRVSFSFCGQVSQGDVQALVSSKAKPEVMATAIQRLVWGRLHSHSHWQTWFLASWALVQGLASVEAYSYKTNEWFFVAPMNTRRSSVGVGVVEGCQGVRVVEELLGHAWVTADSLRSGTDMVVEQGISGSWRYQPLLTPGERKAKQLGAY